MTNDVEAPYAAPRRANPVLPNIKVPEFGFDWHDILAILCLGIGIAGAAMAMMRLTGTPDFSAILGLSSLLIGFGMGKLGK